MLNGANSPIKCKPLTSHIDDSVWSTEATTSTVLPEKGVEFITISSGSPSQVSD
jgi:hypothetical protein